jgi:hypothetical protein
MRKHYDFSKGVRGSPYAHRLAQLRKQRADPDHEIPPLAPAQIRENSGGDCATPTTVPGSSFFAGEYPDMRDEETRLAQARSAGYVLLGSFRLPADDWHAYYAGLEGPLRDAISRHGELGIYAATRLEQAIYEACGDDYGYLCLVLQAAAKPT